MLCVAKGHRSVVAVPVAPAVKQREQDRDGSSEDDG